MNLLFLTLLFPLLGFIILTISRGKWSRDVVATIGVGSITMSMFITIYIIFDVYYNFFKYENYVNFAFVQKLWTWFCVDSFCVSITLNLDGLSLVMLSVITGIGCVIHIYSMWYMRDHEGYSRFFAYTNLFMFYMILLVLSDNLLLMYCGWEGVGFCSYLLIAFYYHESQNGIEALKSFVMTRFGDICLVCALFMIYREYHTLSISALLKIEELQRLSSFMFNSNVTIWIAVMLLIGAIGKSAQLPLHNWLIYAMVGPTPISALIHSATMVTSGVYLVNRMNSFFVIVPNILYLFGIIGAFVVVLFSCSALFQYDLKKILAYSTISQIGYMFVALGNQNWNGAVFHLVTHACSKALLFLAAGSLISACRYEQNIFKMGGLYRRLPFVYACFLIGGASLSGLPIITVGFYSKEMILFDTWLSNNYFFLYCGMIGTILTSIYIFRMIFVIFHGQIKIVPLIHKGLSQNFSLSILVLLSTVIGVWMVPPCLNCVIYHEDMYKHSKICFEIISGILIVFSILMTFIFFVNSLFSKMLSNIIMRFIVVKTIKRYVTLLCYHGWGFDYLYRIIFVRPYLYFIKKILLRDPVDKLVGITLLFLNWVICSLKDSVNGKLSWYVASINVGAIITLIIVLMYI